MSNNNTLPSSTVQTSSGSMFVDARVFVRPPSPNMPLHHGRDDNLTQLPSNFQSYTDTMDFPATSVSYLRPVTPVFGQPCDHSVVMRDSVFPTENPAQAGNNRPDEDWENMPAPVENAAAQGQPRNLGYVDMGYYDMANDFPPLHEHRDLAINNYAGVAPHVPAQPQAAPPDPEIDIFANPVPNAAADPNRALLGGWPHQGPVPNVEVNELLRQLAILYLYDPNSQIAVISMGPAPDQAHGVRVHISLDLH